MKTTLTVLLAWLWLMAAGQGRCVVLDPTVKSLQAFVNQDWLSPPILRLNSDDVLNIGFDQLSHNYHRYTYRVEHCEVDWSVSTEMFESDYLTGFNDNIIDNYENSIGTTVAYTHYTLQLPNDRCQLKMGGNYRLTISDDDDGGRPVAVVEFMVLDQQANVGLEITTNTDIGVNQSHQQARLKVGYGNLRVTRPDDQIYVVVAQNGCRATAKINPKPNIRSNNFLEWTHCRELIFDAGNEYRKYEVLALSHPTMGIDRMEWDGQHYNAYPYTAEPRPNYLYDEDANGAFYPRNSDNIDNDVASDYVFVHYQLKSPLIDYATVAIDGWWTTDADRTLYDMTYDPVEGAYYATLLQKQGYYSYRYVLKLPDGTTTLLPSEGNFYQTENRYQAYVYHRGPTDRTWTLVGYWQTEFRSDR